MTNETSLSTVITTAINSPDCAFYTGKMLGEANILAMLLALSVALFVWKLIDILVFVPLKMKMKYWIKKRIKAKIERSEGKQ